jgi:hypothetical protein
MIQTLFPRGDERLAGFADEPVQMVARVLANGHRGGGDLAAGWQAPRAFCALDLDAINALFGPVDAGDKVRRALRTTCDHGRQRRPPEAVGVGRAQYRAGENAGSHAWSAAGA